MKKMKFCSIPKPLLKGVSRISIRRLIIKKFGNPANAFGAVNQKGENVLISVNSDTGLTFRVFKSDGSIYMKRYDANGYFETEGFGGAWKC